MDEFEGLETWVTDAVADIRGGMTLDDWMSRDNRVEAAWSYVDCTSYVTYGKDAREVVDSLTSEQEADAFERAKDMDALATADSLDEFACIIAFCALESALSIALDEAVPEDASRESVYLAESPDLDTLHRRLDELTTGYLQDTDGGEEGETVDAIESHFDIDLSDLPSFGFYPSRIIPGSGGKRTRLFQGVPFEEVEKTAVSWDDARVLYYVGMDWRIATAI